MSKLTYPLLQDARGPIAQRPRTLVFSSSNVIPKLYKAIFSEEQLELATKLPMNIMALPSGKRIGLLSGPKLRILADGNIVIRRNVPLRALMVSSTKINDLMLLKESVNQYRVVGSVDIESVEQLLDIFTTETGLAAKDIKLMRDNFVGNVFLYQACHSLGIYYTHTKPLFNALRDEISTRLLDSEERNAVVSRIQPTDPLFKHLANDLCRRRAQQQISDIVSFERWLGLNSNKKLQILMIEIDQEHKKRREVFRLGKKERLKSG